MTLYYKVINYLMPSFCYNSDELKDTYELFLLISLITIAFLPIVMLVNLFDGYYKALGINGIALCAVICNILISKESKHISRHYIVYLVSILTMLFCHQLFIPFYTLHNNIFLAVLPLISAVLLGVKSSLRINLIGAIFVLSAPHIGKFAGIKDLASSEKISIASLDALAIICAIVFTYLLTTNLFKRLHHHNVSLKKNARENEYLISVLTHDISNQITVINLAKNKLKKQMPSALLDDALGKIDKRTGNIERIINKIRNTQMVGRIEYHMASISLIDIFEDIVVKFDEKIKDKGVKIDFKYDPNESYSTTADKKILLDNVVYPLVNSGLDLAAQGQTIALALKTTNKNTKFIIAGDAYKLFSSTVLSNIKTGTIQEKEATLSIVSAKRVLEKFDAKLEIHPPTFSGEAPNIQLIFQKEATLH